MRRRLLGLVSILVGLALFLGAGGYRLMNSRTVQVAGELTVRVDTNELVVALTFDDGPTPADTRRILDVLAAEDVRATFFLLGSAVEADRASASEIVAAGHQLGNHSWSHPRMVGMAADDIAREIEDTDRVFREVGYAGPIDFRPPYGKKLVALPLYLAQHQRRTIMWDVAVEDYSSPDVRQSPEELTRLTVEQVRPGSIILLHPWQGRVATQDALRPIIRDLRGRGYRFVTVEELLTYSS